MHRRALDVNRARRLTMVGLAAAVLVVLATTVQASLPPAPEGMAPNMTALIRCEPSVVEGSADAVLAVDIYVQDVVNLYGADVQLTFDTTIAQVVDADPAISGVQIQPLSSFLKPDFVLFKTADNSAGTIHYALTQLNPSEPAAGSGPLARVQFQSLQVGTFSMPFTYNMLSDRNGVEIPSVTQECKVTFTDISPPSSPTATFAPTETAAPPPTITATLEPTATSTASIVPGDTVTLTPTASATIAPPRTVTPTASATLLPSSSPTSTCTPTATPSLTGTSTSTATPTETVSIPSSTPTDTPTSTPTIVIRKTVTPSPTATATRTATPSPEPDTTPSTTPSTTPEATSTPMVVPGRATIKGAVFFDSNRDGVKDVGEMGIAGVLIWAHGLNTGDSFFALTGDDGSFGLPDLPTGFWYLLQEFDPPGYISTTPNWTLVELSHDTAGQAVYRWFGDWRPEYRKVYLPITQK